MRLYPGLSWKVLSSRYTSKSIRRLGIRESGIKSGCAERSLYNLSGGRRQYKLYLGPEQMSEAILRETGLLMLRQANNYISDGIYDDLIRSKCCRKAYLRGAFLGAGTVTNPEKGYHFEWKADDEHLPQVLGKLLEKCDLPFHTYQRSGQQVVYLKGAQQIADALALMGAGQSMLQMENTRIQKQLRAAAVRAANCDEHNGERMLDAAQKQAEAVRRISLKQGLFTLPPALREVARIRLENPDLSLKELGEMLDPPVGKSGINHRMRRLMEIAENL